MINKNKALLEQTKSLNATAEAIFLATHCRHREGSRVWTTLHRHYIGHLCEGTLDTAASRPSLGIPCYLLC